MLNRFRFDFYYLFIYECFLKPGRKKHSIESMNLSGRGSFKGGTKCILLFYKNTPLQDGDPAIFPVGTGHALSRHHPPNPLKSAKSSCHTVAATRLNEPGGWLFYQTVAATRLNPTPHAPRPHPCILRLFQILMTQNNIRFISFNNSENSVH